MPEPLTVIFSFISAVLGGLAASIYTNARADARDDKKLGHDAEQKELDRLLILKREIYYLVIGDFSRLQHFLITLANTPDAGSPTFPSAEQMANYTKLELVAPLPLLKAVQELSEHTREVLLPLMVQRTLLLADKTKLETTGMMYMEALIAWNTQDRKHSQFRVDCMKAALSIRKRLAPVMKEVRGELGMAISMKEFEAVQDRDIKHVEESVVKFERTLFPEASK